MKKIFYVFYLFVIFLSFSSAVYAQDKPADTYGVYLGLIGGYSIPGNDTSATFTGLSGSGFSFDTSLKNGFLYGAKVGWLTPFTNRILAVEFEYNNLENSFSSFNAPVFPGFPAAVNGDLGGKISMNLLMLNLLVRKPEGRFHPYAGAGFGYADVKVDDMNLTPAGIPAVLTISHGSKGVFAYQVLAGMDIDITKNIFVGINYKYIAPQKISYDSNISMGGSAPGSMEVDYKSHNITLSVCYMF
jgi:opacity protein-like surface antigen